MTAGHDGRCGAVLDVLAEAGVDRDGDWQIQQLAGGWSRYTYLLAKPGAQSYVVRVKPPGALLETPIDREYRTYLALHDLDIPVPQVYGLDEREDNPFGGPFFVMDWVNGEAPVVWRKDDRAALERNWADSRSLGTDLVRILARIHGANPAAFAHLGAPRTFAEVVGEWQKTYARQRLVRDPIVEESFQWVLSREPKPVPTGLVHGDYRIGNTMLRDERVAAVVDWELAYLGDPRFDLGYTSLEYLAGKFVRPGSKMICAVAERDWFFAEYERLTGQPVDPEVVKTFAALGALVLITILLTGIRMYSDGQTDDVRMMWNQNAIPGLRQDLARMMGW